MRILPFSLLPPLSLIVLFLSPLYGSQSANEEDSACIDKKKVVILNEVSVSREKDGVRKTTDETVPSESFVNLSLSPPPFKKICVSEAASSTDSSSTLSIPAIPHGDFLRNTLLTKLAALDKRYDEFLIAKNDKGASWLHMVSKYIFNNASEYLGDFATLTSLRASCRVFYFNPDLIKWSYARLYHQGLPKNLTIALYRAVTCISRSLIRPTLLPDEDELILIETELRKDSRFNVAVAFISGVKGDSEAPYKNLKALAASGNQKAQEIVIDALYSGGFGEDGRTEEERFNELMTIAMSGSSRAHQHAQKIAADALYSGEFGQYRRSETEIFEYLTLLARASNAENQYVQKRIIDAIYRGRCGQGERPEAERLAELRAMTTNIDMPEAIRQHAQKLIIDSIYEGTYDQKERPAAERLAELRAIAGGGSSKVHRHAQKRVIDAIYQGCLGQRERPVSERFKELKTIATAGSSKVRQHAQKLVSMALAFGEFDQMERPGKEILDELRGIAAAGNLKGHQDAQVNINEALFHGRFGQDKRCPEERFNELQAAAAAGSSNAQMFVNMALARGVLGQEMRPESERFREIQTTAASGVSKKITMRDCWYG